MSTWDVTVVMPVYNEEDGVAEFLRELNASMSGYHVRFVVVDDCSTDGTVSVLNALADEGLPIELIPSEVNCGHGPATLRALHVALEQSPDVVVAVDGDGQFHGWDLANAVRHVLDNDLDVLEGARRYRTDPWFRRIISAATRRLVRHRCGEVPLDANTPLRVYRPDTLKRLLHVIPSESVTPNLIISVLSRKWGLRMVELPVTHRDRRGAGSCGSTWQARSNQVPSTRLLRFCAIAFLQWMALWKGADL